MKSDSLELVEEEDWYHRHTSSSLSTVYLYDEKHWNRNGTITEFRHDDVIIHAFLPWDQLWSHGIHILLTMTLSLFDMVLFLPPMTSWNHERNYQTSMKRSFVYRPRSQHFQVRNIIYKSNKERNRRWGMWPSWEYHKFITLRCKFVRDWLDVIYYRANLM